MAECEGVAHVVSVVGIGVGYHEGGVGGNGNAGLGIIGKGVT